MISSNPVKLVPFSNHFNILYAIEYVTPLISLLKQLHYKPETPVVNTSQLEAGGVVTGSQINPYGPIGLCNRHEIGP